MMRPTSGEYYSFVSNYIALVEEEELFSALTLSMALTLDWFENLNAAQWAYAYAEGKWTQKEVMQHVLDSERIFAYRALSFARSEKQVLPAFSENDYAAASNANRRGHLDLLQEYRVVRESSIMLFKSFSDEQLKQMGEVPAGRISVRALGFAICGHNLHHLSVCRTRYAK